MYNKTGYFNVLFQDFSRGTAEKREGVQTARPQDLVVWNKSVKVGKKTCCVFICGKALLLLL
jgi:hypothetical protein